MPSLNDGTTIPSIGFGTYPLRGDQGTAAVLSALDLGYRLIDTAVNYGNEDAVGRAVARTDVPRDQIVVTTKLPGRDHGYDETLASFDRSTAALGLDTVDLYLIHWPNPSVGKYVETFRAMVRLKEEGRVRSVGVSNFTPEFLDRVADATGVMPAVNQVELHPFFPQVELRAFHAEHGIVTEAWSPLGKGAPVKQTAPVVAAAAAHEVTPAQVILRWHQQIGSVPIPKSGDPGRQRENLDLDGFTLSDAEVEAITGLGRPDGRLFGGDPNTHEEM
ncbi:aldo/keto reductase [Actinotalea sp. M2MS4P-6]|uniref:aldo/keto reductase n=1 Tax=Actinotalea sp. M2MS4P-6 TaxID=2983762 RepID=UPI0021E48A81|nr:aldo/keto reductase [Actinotalea sp. M2MS4P-6]MCV2393119.1 aldo/keto reductase [Actinotalea sp. M2MS4P-6]